MNVEEEGRGGGRAPAPLIIPGEMEGWREGRGGPRLLIGYLTSMFTVHWRQSDLLKSASPAAPLNTEEY